jgi:hypothetical protein
LPSRLHAREFTGDDDMANQGIDATVTLNNHPFAPPGLRDDPAEAVAAIFQAVERMGGAG